MAWFKRGSKDVDTPPVENRDASWEFLVGSDSSVNGNRTVSTASDAMRLAPVYAAVRLISDSLAASPLHTYRMGEDGLRVRVPNSRLVDKPSAVLTDTEWLGQIYTSLLLTGNAYAVSVAWDKYGYTVQSEVIDPSKVEVSIDNNGLPVYKINGVVFPRSAIMHVRGLSLPGSVVGLSPLALFKSVIEAGISSQEVARSWSSGGMIPSAHLQNTARVLTQDESAMAKAKYRAAVEADGGRNVLVTGSDWKLSPLALPPDIAQFVMQAKLSALQIASIYGVPPESIGAETGSSLTYTTVELQGLAFAQRTLLPWATRLESSLSTMLPTKLFVKHNLDVYARTDLYTRMQAHEVAIRSGVLTINEARALEDRLPLSSDQLAEHKEMYGASKTAAAQDAVEPIDEMNGDDSVE